MVVLGLSPGEGSRLLVAFLVYLLVAFLVYLFACFVSFPSTDFREC